MDFDSDKDRNARTMLDARLIPELLMRLHDKRLTESTLKAFINVINALMGHRPSEEDIRRFGLKCFLFNAIEHIE